MAARRRPDARVKPDVAFTDFVLEQLAECDDVRAQAMFGGFGLYRGADFFGIVHRGVLYFRTDDATRPSYEARGSRPFRPNPRQTLQTYYEVPTEVLEDPPELGRWARDALGAERRRGSRPTPPRARRTGGATGRPRRTGRR